ncbi:PLP-dependent aminotransferase family protein [Rhodobacteraceae bacterium]|nr:PLP-dependent aminotransferase family protein [Paracoccaceae bacterium]
MPKARYLTFADTMARSIQRGRLVPGTKLPTHRAFAEQFDIALATATRVYAELERRGLVVGEAGRGTFVRDLDLPMTLGIHQTASDGLIDLAFNMPGDAADVDALRAGLRKLATAGDLEAMLRYQPHGGRLHERRIIAGSLHSTLGRVEPERLLVTSGGQHGLAIAALGLLRRGDIVAVDALTYPGFKSVVSLQGLDLASIDGVQGIMDPDDLDRQCRLRPIKAVYLMPTVHNPLGSVMDEATRNRLIEVAEKHGLLIIEDSAYAFLEPDPPPTFLALAPERTIHVGGFSKSIATGLRLGYVIAPATHIEQLIEAIRATTWNAPALISGLVTGWVEDGTLAASEETRRRDGAERQQICNTIFEGIPIVAHCNAGFAWLPFDQAVRAEPIVSRLRESGILVSGAEPYATTIAVPQALRLAFGGVPKADLSTVLGEVRHSLRT